MRSKAMCEKSKVHCTSLDISQNIFPKHNFQLEEWQDDFLVTVWTGYNDRLAKCPHVPLCLNHYPIQLGSLENIYDRCGKLFYDEHFQDQGSSTTLSVRV